MATTVVTKKRGVEEVSYDEYANLDMGSPAAAMRRGASKVKVMKKGPKPTPKATKAAVAVNPTPPAKRSGTVTDTSATKSSDYRKGDIVQISRDPANHAKLAGLVRASATVVGTNAAVVAPPLPPWLNAAPSSPFSFDVVGDSCAWILRVVVVYRWPRWWTSPARGPRSRWQGGTTWSPFATRM